MGFIYYQHTLSTLVTAFVGVVPAKALNISSVPRWCLYMRPFGKFSGAHAVLYKPLHSGHEIRSTNSWEGCALSGSRYI